VARTSVGGVRAGVRGTSSSAGCVVTVERNATRRVADAAVAAARGGSGAVDGRPGLIAVSSHVKLNGDITQLLTSVSWYGFMLVMNEVSLPSLPLPSSSSSLLLSVSFC
jgi:hypothetical protein